jgi:pimeloyl-ACP methyl ester carboxylesterase
VLTRCVIGRRDRLFPPAFQRRVIAERLGLVPEEIDAGHLPALSRPDDLAALLLRYAAATGSPGGSSQR